MRSKKKIILGIFIAVVLAFVVGITIFFGSYSHSEPMVEQYLNSSETVKVCEIDNYYYFDGPGNETALIFYPGAKVEAKSYAPLLSKIADNRNRLFFS